MKQYRIRVIALAAALVVVMSLALGIMDSGEQELPVVGQVERQLLAAGQTEDLLGAEDREQESQAAAGAETNPYGEPFRIRCTCYTWTGNPCANGSYPVEGVSVAGKREWLGKAIIMYAEDPETGGLGEFIGFFDFTDTGAGIDTDGDGEGDSLINGTSIDVYRDDMEGVYEWIRRYGDYVYIQIVDAKG